MLFVCLCAPAGQALIQSPDLLVDRGLNVTLSCFQNQTDFNTMSWFQQRPGQALKLVVHYYIQMGGEEKEFTGRFSATRRGPSLDLTVHYLQITDSAVYFCAKQQAQWCASTWGQDKNISPLPTCWGLQVRQFPLLHWKVQHQDLSAEMTCNHTDSSYNQMYWFRQLPGQNMELIVFSNAYGKPDFGNFSKSKYEVKHSVPENGVFTVNMLEPKDSGVYLCAASSHCGSELWRSCSKTAAGTVQKPQGCTVIHWGVLGLLDYYSGF
ncbi:hypothetical protein GN956_G5629 [Arapaima gigas]